jgi:hypothetical protein
MLRDEQRLQLPDHGERWVRIGLSTQAADRAAFEEAARLCYHYGQLPWHGRVVWVSSPPVLLVAAVMTQLMLEPGGEPAAGPVLAWAREHPGAQLLRKALLQPVRKALYGLLGRDLAPDPWYQSAQLELGRMRDRVAVAVQQAVAMPVLEAAAHVSVTDGALYEAAAAAAQQARGRAPGNEVRAALGQGLSLGNLPYLLLQGQFDAGRAAWTSFLREVCRVELAGEIWDRARAYEETVQSASFWYLHPHFILACERPRELHCEVSGRDVHRLHRQDGPAVSWPGGWGVHSIQGRRVPGWVVEHPERITLAHIEEESNAELRRILLERYGFARYISDCGAEVVDSLPLTHDIEGLRGARLLRKVLPGEPEPIVYLEMVNSTAESDGTHRRYLERIDPKAYRGDAGRLCHAAMASRWRHRDEAGQLRLTFEQWQDYRPGAES